MVGDPVAKHQRLHEIPAVTNGIDNVRDEVTGNPE